MDTSVCSPAEWGQPAGDQRHGAGRGGESRAPGRGSQPAARPALPRPLRFSPTCARPMPFYFSLSSVEWGAIARPALHYCLSRSTVSPGHSQERWLRLQCACWVALCPGDSLHCPGHPPQTSKRVPLKDPVLSKEPSTVGEGTSSRSPGSPQDQGEGARPCSGKAGSWGQEKSPIPQKQKNAENSILQRRPPGGRATAVHKTRPGP